MTRFGTRGRRVAAAIGTLIALTLLAAPVSAAPPERELQKATTVTGPGEACGEEWTVTTTSTSLFMLRTGSPADATSRFFFRAHEGAVYLDPNDAARGFVVSTSVLFHDVRVTNLEGTIYQFNSIQTGTDAIATLDGRVVARNSGLLAWTFVIDTNGSTNPDDYELLESTLDRVAGHQPVVEDEEQCAAIAAALAG